MIEDAEKRPAPSGPKLRLSVPPDPRVGGSVRRKILAFAHEQGIEAGHITDFVAAIGEALANAIEHAHTDQPIEITAWLLGREELFASVRDRGVGFSPTERLLSRKLPDGYAERGRGIPIMRRCADVFNVRSAPGTGTRVTIGCRLAKAADHQYENAG